MKKILLLLLVIVIAAILVTGSKVIDAGTEGTYTGVVKFDAGANSGETWGQITEEIRRNALDLPAALSAGIGAAAPVRGSAVIAEFESKAKGKRNALILKVDGYQGTVKIQLGSIFTGTAVRDVQTVTAFGTFTNQTEWSEYAKALNKEVDKRVISPLGIDDKATGKTVEFIGAASANGSEILITPIELNIR